MADYFDEVWHEAQGLDHGCDWEVCRCGVMHGYDDRGFCDHCSCDRVGSWRFDPYGAYMAERYVFSFMCDECEEFSAASV